MTELLLEIGCEEIPAPDLAILPDELKRIATNTFESNRLVFSDIQCEATPRRLVLRAEMEKMQRELREEKLGPPKKVAFDAHGNPTPAGLGFAKNAGIPFKKLKLVTTPKGEYVAVNILVKGLASSRVLKEIIPGMILQLPFHKFMRWESGNVQWGRPIRRLLLLFGGKVIAVQMAGVSATKFTFGHRFLGSTKIPVSSFDDYATKLQENGVVLKYSERHDKILRELTEQVNAVHGKLKADEDLLRTMTNEVEYPEVLTGSFPSSFLSLPQEILINAMRKHQKYFCATDKDDHLLPVFFTVLNTHAAQPEVIRKGHERVLLARLRDAEFFWHEDLKSTLSSRIKPLERLTYQEKLGSYAEKVRRMQSIGAQLIRQLQGTDLEAPLNQVIEVSKVDLLTLMVGEFPELQGQMAGLYARQESYPEDLWKALYDQYLPVSAEDAMPRNTLGALLSLTDRLEILASGYMLNRVPTGSKDPYGLRRVSAGAMKIVLECDLDVRFDQLFEHALSLYPFQPKRDPKELLQGLMELMESRFRFFMEQKGIPHDYLNAILTIEKKSFVDAQWKVLALWSLRDSPDLKTLARVFKRIQNIIYDQPPYVFDAELLQDDGEIRLHRAFSDLEFRVQQNIKEAQYQNALEVMVTLGPEIDNFFDEVLVMTDREELRNNRIALLQRISGLYRMLADFSALQIEL